MAPWIATLGRAACCATLVIVWGTCVLPARAQTSRETPAALAERARLLVQPPPGETSADDAHWTRALALYRRAAAAESDPALRNTYTLGIGICLMHLHHYVEAVHAFDAFAAAGGDAEQTAAVFARLSERVEALAAEGRWSEALETLRALSGSRPTLQMSIGVCLINLQRYVEAMEAFRLFLSSGGEYALLRDWIPQAQLALGIIDIDVDPAQAALSVDGNLQPGDGEHRRVMVDPGEHRIEASASGYLASTIVHVSASGRVDTLRIHLEPVPILAPTASTDLSSEPAFWVLLVGGVVAVGVGVTLGVYYGTRPDSSPALTITIP